jgi:hypothetical protein
MSKTSGEAGGYAQIFIFDQKRKRGENVKGEKKRIKRKRG